MAKRFPEAAIIPPWTMAIAGEGHGSTARATLVAIGKRRDPAPGGEWGGGYETTQSLAEKPQLRHGP